MSRNFYLSVIICLFSSTFSYSQISGASTSCYNSVRTYTAPSGWDYYYWTVSGGIITYNNDRTAKVKWTSPGSNRYIRVLASSVIGGGGGGGGIDEPLRLQNNKGSAPKMDAPISNNKNIKEGSNTPEKQIILPRPIGGRLITETYTKYVTVYNNVSAGSINGAQTICFNTKPSILSNVNSPSGGATLYYKWQKSTTSSSTGFSNINERFVVIPENGSISLSYQPTETLIQDTWYRRRTVSSQGCGTKYSNAVKITVQPNPRAGSIGNPQTICYNTAPTAITNVTSPSWGSVQWQMSVTNDSTGFNTISGATSATYSPPALTQTTWFRRVVSDTNCGSKQSNVIKVFVYDELIGGTQSICYNTAPSMLTNESDATGGTGLVYQWQQSILSATSGFLDISGATATTYAPPVLTQTTWYKRVVSGASCESNVIKVFVYNELIGGIQSICYNTAPSMLTNESDATGGTGLVYQWQQSISSATSGFLDISGATAATYAPPVLTQTTWYKRVVSGASCESNVIKVFVYNELIAGEIGNEQTLKSTEDPAPLTNITSASGGIDLIYQWQMSSTDINSGYIDILTENNAIYDPTPLTQTSWFRRKVTSSMACGIEYTNPVEITIPTTYVPDDNFEQALIDLGYDNVLDDYVLTENIYTITDLNIRNRDINSLTGIEDFLHLAKLDCSQNNLIMLNISNNSELTELYFDYNSLTVIDVSNNLELKVLSANLNSLSSLDVSYNLALTDLSCRQNSLTAIDLTNNLDLKTLSVSNNSLSSLNVLNNLALTDLSCKQNSLTTLDVSNNLELKVLSADRNSLSSLDVSLSTQLSTLLCSNNLLTSLDLTNNLDLKTLSVNNNSLSSLDVSNNLALTALYCYENSLTTLDVSNNLELKVLSANRNSLSSLDVSYNLALTDLSCEQNSLTTIDLTNNLDLKTLAVSNNSLSSLDVSSNTTLSYLHCVNNDLVQLNAKNGNNLNFTNFKAFNNKNLYCIQVDNIEWSAANWINIDNTVGFSKDCSTSLAIPDNSFEQALINQGYDDVLDNFVAYNNIKDITYLDVSSLGINNLSGIEGFTSLTNLNCSSNRIRELDLKSNSMLQVLDCSNNGMTSLDLSQNSVLVSLQAQSNFLMDLNVKNGNNSNSSLFYVQNNPYLKCIQVDDQSWATTNWINIDVDVSFSEDCGNAWNYVYVPDDNFEQALINLGYDDILDNYVSANLIKEVKSLIISQNNISDLTGIEGFRLLNTLDCSFNKLTKLRLTTNFDLTSLKCNSNQISSIDLNTNINLTYLQCSFNKIPTLDISSNISLEYLYCTYNNIVSLNVLNNPKLKHLSCSSNSIATLNLGSNSDLVRLYCTNNALESLNLMNGNNGNLSLAASNNRSLGCIQVDDPNWSVANWTNIDEGTGFSQNCSLSINIRDDNFEQALINKGYDDILDNLVLINNIELINHLDVSSLDIYDLTGIEGFTSLTNLNCSNNELFKLNLEANSMLEVLDCSNNAITSLDLSRNLSLSSLQSHSNFLLNLDVRNGNNLNITYFSAQNNPFLKCIQVDNQPWATTNWINIDAELSFSEDCSNTWNYAFIPDDNFEQALIYLGYDDVLDDYVLVDNIKNIEFLYIVLQGITDLTGIEAFQSLLYLDISVNQLNSINLNANGALVSLFCYGNDLSYLDVSSNRKLTRLRCQNNNISSLDLSSQSKLNELNCSYNIISKLDLSKNNQLTSIACRGNSLVELNIKNGNNLNVTRFWASNNPNLNCIQVDNVAYSTTNWISIDPASSFSEDCGYANTNARSSSTATEEFVFERLESSNFNVEDISIYPSPAHECLTVQFKNAVIKETKIQVYDQLGQLTYTTTLVKGNSQIELATVSWTPGIYYIQTELNGEPIQKRIIVQH